MATHAATCTFATALSSSAIRGGTPCSATHSCAEREARVGRRAARGRAEEASRLLDGLEAARGAERVAASDLRLRPGDAQKLDELAHSVASEEDLRIHQAGARRLDLARDDDLAVGVPVLSERLHHLQRRQEAAFRRGSHGVLASSPTRMAHEERGALPNLARKMFYSRAPPRAG